MLHKTNNKGQSMTEVLVGMLVLWFLLTGFFDLVRALNLYTVLNEAADVAVRMASMPNSSPVTRAAMRNRIIELVNGAGYDTTYADIDPTPTAAPIPNLRIYFWGESGARNTNALVQIVYPFEFTYLKQVIPAAFLPIPQILITASRTRANE